MGLRDLKDDAGAMEMADNAKWFGQVKLFILHPVTQTNVSETDAGLGEGVGAFDAGGEGKGVGASEIAPEVERVEDIVAEVEGVEEIAGEGGGVDSDDSAIGMRFDDSKEEISDRDHFDDEEVNVVLDADDNRSQRRRAHTRQ